MWLNSITLYTLSGGTDTVNGTAASVPATTTSSSTHSSSSSHSTNIGPIVGGVIGSVVIIFILLLIGIFCIRRRRKEKYQNQTQAPAMMHYPSSTKLRSDPGMVTPFPYEDSFTTTKSSATATPTTPRQYPSGKRAFLQEQIRRHRAPTAPPSVETSQSTASYPESSSRRQGENEKSRSNTYISETGEGSRPVLSTNMGSIHGWLDPGTSIRTSQILPTPISPSGGQIPGPAVNRATSSAPIAQRSAATAAEDAQVNRILTLLASRIDQPGFNASPLRDIHEDSEDLPPQYPAVRGVP